MSAMDWATFSVATVTVVGSVAAGVRWLVKHYLAELKPNSGGSLNDRVARIENQIDRIYEILIGGTK